ncbi:MAG: type II toxin-antitoxin system RelE family toxin [Beijerinckiaceae bacterium]
MKQVRYSSDALLALRKHRSEAQQIMAKIERYAKTGAGDVKRLVGSNSSRLRVGDYRVIFNEDDVEIAVSVIGPRGSVYE